jgi:hypothetical protein
MKQITRADFLTSPVLASHARRSKEVARALDQQAPTLPYAKVFTSFEFEEFLGQAITDVARWRDVVSQPILQYRLATPDER